MLSGAIFYDCINTIYEFIKPFMDNTMSIFEEYGAFKLCPQREMNVNLNANLNVYLNIDP